MGTDKRPNDLADSLTATQVASLLSTLIFPVDDASFSGDIKKLSLNVLLDSTKAAQTSPSQSRGMTPAGFKASVASETETGVGRFATDTEIADKTGDFLLRSGKIAKLIEAIFAQTLEINTSNKDTYIDAFSNITLVSVNIRMYVIGKTVHIFGGLNGAIQGTTPQLFLRLKNVPVPAFKSGFNGTIEVSATNRPVSGTIEKVDSLNLLIRLGVQWGSNVPGGNYDWYFSSTYISE